MPVSAQQASIKDWYQCGGNDVGSANLILYNDQHFIFAYDWLDKPVKPRLITGTYTEGPNTYDLFFKNMTKAQTSTIFDGDKAGGFAGDRNAYRISKNPGGLNQFYMMKHRMTRQLPENFKQFSPYTCS